MLVSYVVKRIINKKATPFGNDNESCNPVLDTDFDPDHY